MLRLERTDAKVSVHAGLATLQQLAIPQGTANRTSSKNMEATWRYSGDLNAKSTSKSSQVVCGVGPSLTHRAGGDRGGERRCDGLGKICECLCHQGRNASQECRFHHVTVCTTNPAKPPMHTTTTTTTRPPDPPAHLNSHLLVRCEKSVESSTREWTAVGECSVTLEV